MDIRDLTDDQLYELIDEIGTVVGFTDEDDGSDETIRQKALNNPKNNELLEELKINLINSEKIDVHDRAIRMVKQNDKLWDEFATDTRTSEPLNLGEY